VSGGTLSIAAAQPVVVALFRTAFSSGTVVKAWPKRGIAPAPTSEVLSGTSLRVWSDSFTDFLKTLPHSDEEQTDGIENRSGRDR
jgi:hypothetical protein